MTTGFSDFSALKTTYVLNSNGLNSKQVLTVQLTWECSKTDLVNSLASICRLCFLFLQWIKLPLTQDSSASLKCYTSLLEFYYVLLSFTNFSAVSVSCYPMHDLQCQFILYYPFYHLREAGKWVSDQTDLCGQAENSPQSSV